MFSSYSMVDLTKDYFRFHYGRSLSEYAHICKNLLVFIWHFFSLGLLFKSLFHPLKRLGESYPHGLNAGEFFSALVINFMMRLVGFVVRSTIIVMGLVAYAFAIPLMAFVFIFWVFMPIIIALAMSASLTLILRSVIK